MDREIQHVLEQAHTVRQLIGALEGMDQDARVLFTCSYGDYHNTKQVLPVADIEEYESDLLAESGYGQSGIAFVGDGDEPDEVDEDEIEAIVILS